ncbi:hypothetical protein BJF93_07615 [Xaviernesmea oryzae]|uniref:Uncharacterized protein n=1 Tax=Xaviernesmea oryzae TaxID=464029 RepID=A0A1Q9B1U7_9HYPH|nr:hypothetical protein BJF93_07615 [Xaviernesmea oryzae]
MLGLVPSIYIGRYIHQSLTTADPRDKPEDDASRDDDHCRKSQNSDVILRISYDSRTAGFGRRATVSFLPCAVLCRAGQALSDSIARLTSQTMR